MNIFISTIKSIFTSIYLPKKKKSKKANTNVNKFQTEFTSTTIQFYITQLENKRNNG